MQLLKVWVNYLNQFTKVKSKLEDAQDELDNIISCLNNLDCQIYTISNNTEVINFAKERNVHNYSSKKNGLNND